MAATPTDSAIDSGVIGPRRRGKSKAPNFTYDDAVSVIRLELDASNEPLRRRLERHWGQRFGCGGLAARRCDALPRVLGRPP